VAFKEALTPEFKTYQQQIVRNAKALAAGLMKRSFRLVSGGTDNHLMLLDLRATELTGKIAQETLDQARITTNKNTVPFETRSPMVTSGVRIGTPALTTRGMKEREMELIGGWIASVLNAQGEAAVIAGVREKVRGLAQAFPLYKELED
jgi:glycine hydroxymethyltransferase